MSAARKIETRVISRERPANAGRPRRGSRVAFGLVAVAGAVGLVSGVATSPYFAVERIEVCCPMPAVGEEVARVVQIRPGATIFTVRAAGLQRQAQACPRVKSIRVGRRWRKTLIVVVEPREPACGIRTPAGWLLADLDGVCIERSQLAPPGLPRVRGIPLAAARPGDTIQGPRMAAATECVRLAQRLPALSQITVDVSSPGDVTVTTAGGTRGILGDCHDLGPKLARFAAALETFRARGWQAEYVDIRRLEVPAVWKPRAGSSP